MRTLTLKDTLTDKKKKCVPEQGSKISMYVCGITPYDYAHIGHGRCYVTFDVLYRLLRTLGYDVTYCRNFTDIDDKLLARAAKERGDKAYYSELAQKFIDAYHEDMAQLHCLQPAHEPRVTDVIPEIIAFIQGLIEKGLAYESNGSVYFSVEKFKDYGKLSKRDIDDLIAGARVEVSDEKRNPLDFALWKAEPNETIFWDSPWGHGRPGWHIECSVMAKKHLGSTIDIHGGGMDLIFPHHENEIAQSEGLHDLPYVKNWVHNAFVRIDQEKMSKSLGNFFTLRQVFENYDPMVVRFMILNHHYRSPLDFSFDDLDALQRAYKRLCGLFADTKAADTVDESNPVVARMLDFLCDDLNTPGMFGVVFENIKEIQSDEQTRAAVKKVLQDILGLSLEPIAEQVVVITPEMQAMIDEREQARLARDWARADLLRDKLRDLGYEVQDKKL